MFGDLDDEEDLQLNNPEAFALKIAHRIGEYIRDHHRIEIIRMSMQFSQNDFGVTELVGVSDLWVRMKH
jgi:urease gamma subunit